MICCKKGQRSSSSNVLFIFGVLFFFLAKVGSHSADSKIQLLIILGVVNVLCTILYFLSDYLLDNLKFKKSTEIDISCLDNYYTEEQARAIQEADAIQQSIYSTINVNVANDFTIGQ